MWFLLIVLWGYPQGGEGESPHQVYNVTWTITNLMTGARVTATSVRVTLADAFPTLYFDLCDVVGPSSSSEFGCSSTWGLYRTQLEGFYVCPGHKDQKSPSLPAPARPPVLLEITRAPDRVSVTSSSLVAGSDAPTPQPSGTGDRLINLVTGAYLALNYSDPSRTQECWLCLVHSPPYYEGVAVLGNYINQTMVPDHCTAIPSHKLTLPEVSGQGLCLGNVPPTHRGLCKATRKIHTGNYYLAAPTGTYWACNTRLTPCVSVTVLNQSSDYCVLVELWPKVTYHEPEDIYSFFEGQTRFKREPLTMTLALLLGGITLGGMAAGIGTGTTALIETGHFRQLQVAMNADLKALEESVSALEKSLTSLSEVVLQNRRGLDMLFLREGGLCAALKEECCFYADHTGIVRDNMAKLRERLAQRQKLFDSQQGWFEGLVCYPAVHLDRTPSYSSNPPFWPLHLK